VPVVQNSQVTATQIAAQGGAAVGTIEYAYVDNIGRLVQGHQTNLDDFSSVVWTVISNQLAFSGQPALGQQSDGRLQLAGRNIDSAEWTNTQTTATPPVFDSNAWASQGGLSFSPPAVGRESDGRLILFATDANGVLWTLPQTAANGRYGVWSSLGDADLVGTPAVIKVSNGLRVFALDTAGALKTALLSSGTLSAGHRSHGVHRHRHEQLQLGLRVRPQRRGAPRLHRQRVHRARRGRQGQRQRGAQVHRAVAARTAQVAPSSAVVKGGGHRARRTMDARPSGRVGTRVACNDGGVGPASSRGYDDLRLWWPGS
jgi:hypothetical protein